MKLAILVTQLEMKKAAHTTIRLAREATNRGHEVWFFTAGDFAFDPDDTTWIRARRVPRERYKSSESYLSDLLKKSVQERVAAADLDILLLRDNPAKYDKDSSWALSAGVTFGRAALSQGVVVLNDPNGLARARNKMYFQTFPRELRAKTLITRCVNEIRKFENELEGDLILKPLQGSGGDSVFIVKKNAHYNLNQLVESLVKKGYIIAQEYLPAAERGDLRIFLMNGRPLKTKGKYAAFQRVRKGDDIRSNMHAGGTIERAVVDETVLKLCEMVRPKLVADGMFLVGLDVVGDKIMEVNVFCPGGLEGMEKLEGANFSAAVVEALERKYRYSQYVNREFDNLSMACL